MDKQSIFEVIVQHAREVIPALVGRDIAPHDSLKLLGANSVDRSEIIMMTLETLELDIPLMQMAKADNIGELSRIMLEKMPSA
ncbi:acyl carrier protein [Janthinobacterium sp. FT14W]|uniref:acyl carrier protein n=1 Tax=Janthinobacterium sp. FT14W TaxID=2654253 RepID=UPI001264AA59|nr:acyl carrier protein [Janthinobacterium sp. FT14W]KAB8061479.1 acyl carrier protein [Janthinobacterium sp. FT14W]